MKPTTRIVKITRTVELTRTIYAEIPYDLSAEDLERAIHDDANVFMHLDDGELERDRLDKDPRLLQSAGGEFEVFDVDNIDIANVPASMRMTRDHADKAEGDWYDALVDDELIASTD